MTGRVAITIPASGTIHVGHARTLLLGSLICRERGIEFVVRLDGTHASPPNIDCICDIHDCLDHIGVHATIRRTLQAVPPPEFLATIVGDRADELYRATQCPTITPGPVAGALVDDIVHHPSLIIRGIEFSSAAYFPEGGSGTAQHVMNEDLLFRAAGLDKIEVNLPHINLGASKFSKTKMIGVQWDILRSVPGDVARSFLIATAMFPQDPVPNIGCGFSSFGMPMVPYQWSWDDWNAIVRAS